MRWDVACVVLCAVTLRGVMLCDVCGVMLCGVMLRGVMLRCCGDVMLIDAMLWGLCWMVCWGIVKLPLYANLPRLQSFLLSPTHYPCFLKSISSPGNEIPSTNKLFPLLLLTCDFFNDRKLATLDPPFFFNTSTFFTSTCPSWSPRIIVLVYLFVVHMQFDATFIEGK
jgi:hypothetical protein